MDLSPSPFWIKKHQQSSSVFDFKNIPVDIHQNDENSEDETSEIIIGKKYFL